MKRLVILAPLKEEQRRIIELAASGYEVIDAPGVPAEEQIALLQDCEICVGEPEWEAILKSDSLHLIQMTWAGADRYTRTEKKFPEGIRLCTASGAFGHAMSHYALAGVLSLYHHLPEYQKQQQQRKWNQLPAEISMIGATILIFGTGNIGSCTARLFRAAGAERIIGVRRKLEHMDGFDEICRLDDAEAYLPEADIVIGCMPSAAENDNYLNEKRISMMKKGAVLVNMGRGTFLELDALYDSLQNGSLYGAVLDVFNPEPLPEEHPIWNMPNVIITPHVAGPSKGNPVTERLIAEICRDNISRYIAGEELRNRIF